jgi:hypothetical protein
MKPIRYVVAMFYQAGHCIDPYRSDHDWTQYRRSRQGSGAECARRGGQKGGHSGPGHRQTGRGLQAAFDTALAVDDVPAALVMVDGVRHVSHAVCRGRHA